MKLDGYMAGLSVKMTRHGTLEGKLVLLFDVDEELDLAALARMLKSQVSVDLSTPQLPLNMDPEPEPFPVLDEDPTTGLQRVTNPLTGERLDGPPPAPREKVGAGGLA